MSIKSKIIDKVSDVLSYPARRAAQKSILNADKEFKFAKSANKLGMEVHRENKIGGGTELIAQRRALKTLPAQASARAVQATNKPQLSQRDTYAKAMNAAQRNGGSNGIGVGR